MKEKEKYTSCPFCGSSDIVYFDALTKAMFQERYGNKKEEELAWYEKLNRDLYMEYSCDVYASLLKEQKREGRAGICKSCGMEFREFIQPELDEKIKSLKRIPIEEYIQTMTQKIESLSKDSGNPFDQVLLYAVLKRVEHKKFWFKERMEEEIEYLDRISELTKN